MSWMDSSGGLIYHLRARFHRSLWADHLQAVQRFLSAWNPSASTLILIGPSGGYSLPPEFLKRFKKIIAYEPDSLARFIFEKRMGIKPEWVKRPFRFEPLIESFPEGAILFCNLLGQIPIHKLPQFRLNLIASLQGREWASFQDAYSSVHGKFGKIETESKKLLSTQLKPAFENGNEKKELEVTEHEAFGIFKDASGLRFSYWGWQLTPQRSHLIEGVYFK